MARTETTGIVPVEVAPITPEFSENLQLAQRAAADADKAVVALARELNYQGSTDPSALESSARDVIRRLGMGIFELGGYLLLLKAACPHGTFLPVLERLDIGVDAAQRYMSVTRRFSNTATSRHLAALGVNKLVELLPLDDEALNELSELGRTGELALDDVARLSVRELRAAVRDLRAERVADQEVLEKKNQRIDKLERNQQRIKRLPAERQTEELKAEASAIGLDALARLRGDLRAALQALATDDGDNTVFSAGLVGQLVAELATLREEFNLPDVSTAADLQLAGDVAQWGKKAPAH